MFLSRLAKAAGPAITMLDGESVDYPELWFRSSRFAGGVEAITNSRNLDVILIFAPMSVQAVVAFVGVMIAGAMPAFMPLPSAKQDPGAFWDSHRRLFRHIGVGCIVAPRDFLEQIAIHAPDNPLPLICLEDIDGEPIAPRPRREAFLQHSSGTTGLKKGVVITHEQLAWQIEAYAPQVGVTSGSVIASWLPLYHDMGLIACMLLPLYMGCHIVYIDTFRWNARPRLLFRAIEDYRATHVWMPNFAFAYMARLPIADGDLSSVDHFVNCSEVCKPQAFAAFRQAFGKFGLRDGALTCCYAMAEAVFAISQSDSAVVTDDALSSGRPVPGVELRIVDDAGDATDFGQIEIRGPFVFDGYFKDPERTARAFRDGWYRSGDLGRLVDGQLVVSGRMDDMMIINGRNLMAHQVEDVASQTAGVLPGRAVAFEIDPDGLSALVIACECEAAENQAATVAERIYSVFSIAPRVTIVPPGTLLKTTSGKMDRRRNRERYLEGRLASWR